MKNTIKNSNQRLVAGFRRSVEDGWPTPSVGDSYRFTIQELGEMDSVAMRLGHEDSKHVRNNFYAKDRLAENLLLEAGQAFMMFITYANALGVDLNVALIRALEHQRKKLT